MTFFLLSLVPLHKKYITKRIWHANRSINRMFSRSYRETSWSIILSGNQDRAVSQRVMIRRVRPRRRFIAAICGRATRSAARRTE